MEDILEMAQKYPIDSRVCVTCGNEGGDDEDDEWVGHEGTVRGYDGDGYYEVELDGQGKATFQFSEYQLAEA